MKKIIFIAMMLLAVVGCSDDDNSNKTSKVPLVSKITIVKSEEPNQVIEFIYDEQNRLVQTIQNGTPAYKYVYNEKNGISKMLRNDKVYAAFHYNANDIITGYEFGDSGQISPVTYESATNTYRFPPNKFTLEENGDVNATFNQKIIFTDRKGPFANVGGKNLQLMHHFVGMLTLITNKVAVEEILDLNGAIALYELETQYNEAGYPIKIEVENLTGSDDSIITLEY